MSSQGLSITVVPSTITTSQTITYFTVKIINLELFSTCTLLVQMYDANNNILNTQIVSLTNAEYMDWMNDDNYIVNFAATRLGLTATAVNIPQ